MSKNIVECIHWDPAVDPALQADKKKSKLGWIVAGAAVAGVALMVCLVLFGPLGNWLGSTLPPDEPETGWQQPTQDPATPTTQGWETQPTTEPPTQDPNLAQAKSYYGLNQYEAALPLFGAALAADPDSVDAYTYRGMCFFFLERFQEAIGDFTQALVRSPDSAAILALRGGSYYRTGYYPEAISDLSRSIAIAPDKTAYNYRSMTYEAMGQHALAVADQQAAEGLQ